MWKPPERIKYEPSPGIWPSAQQARSARLFQPLSYQALDLAERTWVPAMVPWRATENGDVTQDNIDWYGRFAKGQPGAVVVEATGIRDVPSGPLLRIGHDRYIDGLSRIAEQIHLDSNGHSRALIQLIDFLNVRRRPEPGKFLKRFLTITPEHLHALNLDPDTPQATVREQLQTLSDDELREALSAREYESLSRGDRERVTDMHLPHIADLPAQLPELFAAAARRAKQAGFDGVELHYAHAYTMASFLSATNDRHDGYGGSIDARKRLALEVIEAVRAEVGRDHVVGCRFLADECIPGGSNVADACEFGIAFAAAGLDFISLSRGGKFDDAKQPKAGWAVYPYTGPSGYECMPQYLSDANGPFGRNLEACATIRSAIREAGYDTPVIAAGGIHNFEQAESVLAHQQGDIVGFARQAMADPDWFIKVRSGHGEEVRLCVYSNYCEGLDQKHKQVTCNLWDRLDDGKPCAMTHDGKRRLTAPEWQPVTLQQQTDT